MTYDLGQTKIGNRIITKKCLRCSKQLCSCIERQIDGSWKEMNYKEEIINLKAEIETLKNAKANL